MGRFSYKAINQGGGYITGTIEAADRRSAVAGLADNGQFAIELEETEGPSVIVGGRILSFQFLSNLL